MREDSGGDLSLQKAAHDVRHLIDRGYPKESAVRFVCDHHRLPDAQRFIIARVVVPAGVALSRMRKKVAISDLLDMELMADGYNILITCESLMGGRPVYVCDDGFLRDAQGIFRSYRPSELTAVALDEMISILRTAAPGRIDVLLDEQMSESGLLAAQIRKRMESAGLLGRAFTARDVDRRLKAFGGTVASGDGSVIDSAGRAVDIPGEIAIKRGLSHAMTLV